MASVIEKIGSATAKNEDIPQWKKDLIARLRNHNKKSEERLLWIEHHAPHHHALQTHHPHPKTDLVCSPTTENGFGKDRQSPESSDSEDLHYGPGIVNKLRNKYLSLALRESNARPTILRKATSLENLLDEDEEEEEGGGKEDGRLFRRRGGGNDGGSNMNRYRQSNRRQEMKRARSVEAISRTNHDEELTMTSSVTAKINNRQSLHEEILIANSVEKGGTIIDTRAYKKSVPSENGTEDTTNKYNGRINRPRRLPPLLIEREKPPVDVVKHAKMIFEKKPETRTKKPPQTGDVAAKVDSFNNIIVKSKSCSKVAKPPVKTTKPVLNDKPKSNTQNYVRPVAKPVILSEELSKPKSLDLKGPRAEKKGFNSLTSPIPDVSRVEIKNQDGSDPRTNSVSSLCETPDLILTSSPIPKITSPTYRKRSTEDFIEEERNSSFLGHTDTTNRYISPLHSSTKVFTKPPSLNFNKEDLDNLGMKMISPISQKNITKNSASAVFNFLNSHVDQNHLPVSRNSSDQKISASEPLKIEVNGFNSASKPKMGLSAFEIEKNQRNAVNSGLDGKKISGASDVGDGSKRQKVGSSEDIFCKKDEVVERRKKFGSTEDILCEKDEVVEGKKEKSSISVVEKESVDKSRLESNKIGQDVVGLENEVVSDRGRKKWQSFGKSVEITSSLFENHIKSNSNSADMCEHHHKNGQYVSESTNNTEKLIKMVPKPEKTVKPEEPSVLPTPIQPEPSLKLEEPSVKPSKELDKTDRTVTQTQNKSASSVKSSASSGASEEAPVRVALPKKPKARIEETTTAVFNFTSRKDVPDYIANDKSRTPSRIVLPKPDEPGIKLLPEALLANFKEIQEVWEEDELIRSLEARPPSPCDITFINDNILIDGKSNLLQHSSKRLKLKISFVDDADIYEYPSETSLLLEDSPLPSPLGGAAQVGHTVPALSGSSLATYTPKTTETFQLGITKIFQEPVATPKPDVADVSESSSGLILEEVDQPMLFSSGGTSDILF